MRFTWNKSPARPGKGEGPSTTSRTWVDIVFRLTIRVPKGYFLCLVGSCPELGQWRPQYSRVMERVLDTHQEDMWQLGVMVRREAQVRYRFFICKPVWTRDKGAFPKDEGRLVPADGLAGPGDDFPLRRAVGLSIMCWESFTEPHTIDIAPHTEHVELPLRSFGCREHSPKEWSRGWLVGLSRVRLIVYGADVITLRHLDVTGVKVFIRCTPLDCSQMQAGTPRKLFRQEVKGQGRAAGQTNSEASRDSAMKQEPLSRFIQACQLPVTSFSHPVRLGPYPTPPPFAGDVLYWKSQGVLSHPHYQPELGVCYREGECLNFDCDTACVGSLGFRFDFHTQVAGHDREIYIGCAFMLPAYSSSGQRTLPIFCKARMKVGEFKLRSLVVHPMPGHHFTMETSFLNQWRAPPLSFDKNREGHGEPSKYKHRLMCSLKENTLASFKATADLNVTLVQCDVLLTADKVPVIYKSLTAPIACHKRCPLASHEVYCLEVHKLSLGQLSSARLHRFSQDTQELINCDNACDPADLRPFPTLEQCLTSVDQSLGFNIVVKYPHSDDVTLCGDYFDRNLTIDVILDVILTNAGNRKVVLSSSDPDICIMMQIKQNRYPVLFLSEGVVDKRCRDVPSILNLAQAERLQGVSLSVSEIMTSPEAVSNAQKMGLAVFVWGDAIGLEHTAELLARYNVSVVTYASVDFAVRSAYTSEVFEIDSHARQIELAGARVIQG